MKAWKEYWNRAPLVYNENPMEQVGKTVNGIPITEGQFAAIITDIRQRLVLHADDLLLDLCCGNGAVTSEIARHCGYIVGADFSEPLIRTARTRFPSPNSEYVLADVCALPAGISSRPFTRIYMYEALQHFSAEQVGVLLAQFGSRSGLRPDIYLGSIPDAARIRNFYNTPDRWAEYETRLADGTESIGHWWSRDELVDVMHRHGYRVIFMRQDSGMHGAHYRFDALCIPLEPE